MGDDLRKSFEFPDATVRKMETEVLALLEDPSAFLADFKCMTQKMLEELKSIEGSLFTEEESSEVGFLIGPIPREESLRRHGLLL